MIKKAVILAGGLGTRLSEETHVRPKPMVEIGDRPILWHIMKMYSHYGINDFIICLGYKGYAIKEYFTNYYNHTSDLTLDFRDNTTTIHRNKSEPWKVTLVDTGEYTQTGGRLKRVREFLDENPFCFTYGDGIADVNINSLIDFHLTHQKLATITAVRPPARFGALKIDDGELISFQEKPLGDGAWINGGFFVLSPKVIDYIESDETAWEHAPLEKLTKENQVSAHEHEGFWRPMDTLRDKHFLNQLWQAGNAPWKIWD